MDKYTKKYILFLTGGFLLAILLIAIQVIFEETGEKPWIITVIYYSMMATFTHIVAETIYEENKDEKSNLNMPGWTIGFIFLTSIINQIVCTFAICSEAWKRFGDMHFIEYIIGAIFLLISAYFFKRSVYKLINKRNKK